MTIGNLHRVELSAILEQDKEPVHEVIKMRARNQVIRLFCNYCRCPYEDRVSTDEEAERSATEHETLNEY